MSRANWAPNILLTESFLVSDPTLTAVASPHVPTWLGVNAGGPADAMGLELGCEKDSPPGEEQTEATSSPAADEGAASNIRLSSGKGVAEGPSVPPGYGSVLATDVATTEAVAAAAAASTEAVAWKLASLL
jgi:hypothetical protein